MVRAELCYRHFVPYGWFAVKTSNVRFYGNDEIERKLRNLAHLIEFEKAYENEAKIGHYSKRREMNTAEFNEVERQIKDLKQEHLFWMLCKDTKAKMAALKSKREDLMQKDEYLGASIIDLNEDKYISAYELTSEFKTMLSRLKFSVKAACKDDSNLHTENYESTCSDEELMAMVERYTAEVELRQANAIADINREYGWLSKPKNEDLTMESI